MAKSSSGSNKSADKPAASTPPNPVAPAKKIIAPEHAEPLRLPISGGNPNKRKVYLPPKITPRVNGTISSPVAPTPAPQVESAHGYHRARVARNQARDEASRFHFAHGAAGHLRIEPESAAVTEGRAQEAEGQA